MKPGSLESDIYAKYDVASHAFCNTFKVKFPKSGTERKLNFIRNK